MLIETSEKLKIVPQMANGIQSWRFGVYQVDLQNAELRRSGIPLKIREQCFRILVYLLEHAGELVTRDELRRQLWPADTFVDFEHSMNAAMMKLRETLGDSVDAPMYIETVPKRGYRFIAPVTHPATSPSQLDSESSSEDTSRTGATPASAAVPDSAKAAIEECLWIAVRPFKWSGPDPSLAGYADGATEDILTGLSRFSYLRVVAASAHAHHGKSADAEHSGPRYILEGSLRQAGPRLRLSAQLVDRETGAHLWAATYDRDFTPHAEFDLLDDIVPQIVSTIADSYGVLPRNMGETLRSVDPARLTPYEAVLRCFAYFQRLSAEEHLPVRMALERAVEHAPAYADAWAMLSLIYKEEFTHGFNLGPDPLDRALAAARRAVELAPSNHLAHHALAASEFFRKEFQRFRLSAARALELNPMDGFTLAYLGFLIAYAGDWKRGGVLSASARRLNPHHPGWYWFVPGMDAYRNGEYRAALEFADRTNMPEYWRTSLLIAAARGQMGDKPAAERALNMLLVRRPDFARAPHQELAVWWQPDLVEQLMVGLKKAGLEE
ncbi:winged helix-turn-helix domain-containing protein [Granulicella aggregans]|uniref:winged helix-turn-helix domain-containing protein n=1 Tax=Granulicella aggregans TaxID=474949 RepID=UPI0021E0CEB6|nr:winged helix-turn-helix domain-containing protein [Granulicella aggregans]